jgi:hypothetical protein
MNTKAISALFCLVLVGCSTHYLKKGDLIQQLQENGRRVYLKKCRNGVCMMEHDNFEYVIPSSNRLDSISRENPGRPTLAWIDFNGIEEIRCRNKSGEMVKVGVDHNSQMLFFDKDGKKTQFYFKTGRYEGGTFYGLRSVILGIEKSIDENAVDSIEVYSEFKVERRVKQ